MSEQTPIAEKLLATIREDAVFNARGGNVADYIPELRVALRNKVGISVHYPDDSKISVGDCSRSLRGPEGVLAEEDRASDDTFSMQSISKVFALLYVLERRGESNVFKRIGKEPTGDPFNADPRVRAKGDVRIPYNPMINVGAGPISRRSTPVTRLNAALEGRW